VTHGHTFCTIENFDAVAEAVAECAFATSQLPVSLSLEMHCSPSQQYRLAATMVKHIGEALLSYEELSEIQRAAWLSPADLKTRVLARGKVKLPRKTNGTKPSCRNRFAGLATRPASLLRNSLRSCSRGDSQAERSSTVVELRSTCVGVGPEASASVDKDRLSRSSSVSEFDAPLTVVDSMANGRRRLDKKVKASKNTTNEFYAQYLSMRSVPLHHFLRGSPPKWALPISSINEDRLLKELGLSAADCNQLEGLHVERSPSEVGRTEEQQVSQAALRLAADPPLAVGRMQQRTTSHLLRPYPLGLRLSGKNMSPLPGWLAGAHCVCLNFSDCDLAVQLHFALFNGMGGYVLKPAEMLRGVPPATAACEEGSLDASSCGICIGQQLSKRESADRLGRASRRNSTSRRSRGARESEHGGEGELHEYWPPPADTLQRTTIHLLSLLHLPKRFERRPRYDGSRSACHDYHPELSGVSAPPDNVEPSAAAKLSISLHPIGGFCAVGRGLQFRKAGAELIVSATEPGMPVSFGEEVHCVAQEANATILRVGVTEGRKEVAYESVVLGRLRPGHRVLQLRSSATGTRIELCCVFIRISFGVEPNLQVTARLHEMKMSEQRRRISELERQHSLACSIGCSG